MPLQYQFLAKFILILVLTGVGAIGGWRLTSDYYQSEILRLQAENDAAVKVELQRQLKLTQDRAELSRLAEEQHAKDQLTINRLGIELSRVRVHLPAVSCGAVSRAGKDATDSNRKSGLAAARADEYLDEARRAIQDNGQRCSQLNIDAIAANSRTKNIDAPDSVIKTGD